METTTSNYPEHDKMHLAITQGSEAIGQFLEWLFSNGYEICKWRDKHEEFFPVTLESPNAGVTGWIAEYFDIDLTELDDEKRAMLDEIRKQDAEPTT